jgi:hypothetical protein
VDQDDEWPLALLNVARLARGEFHIKPLGRRRFWPSPSASYRPTTETLGFGIGEVEFSHALSRIPERDANGRALSIRNLLSRHV